MTRQTVVQVIESDGPGGAETIMAQLVRHTDSGRLRSLAVVPSAGGWLGRTLPVAKQRISRPSPRETSWIVDRSYVRSLRDTFAADRPALVHAHSFDATLYSALALTNLDSRLVATFHGASDILRLGAKNRVKWLALKRASRVVCVSHSLSKLASNARVLPTDRISTIYNGVDFARVSEMRLPTLRRKLGLPDSTLLVGALGNVRSPKGYDFLLTAIHKLRQHGLDLHLVIAGDDRGTLAGDLRAQRAALGLDETVTFLGFTDDPESFLQNLDIYVLSSRSEGFSLSTVQAMASGLPVVATRSGGPEELITDDVSGVLVPPESSTALAEAIAGLASDSCDRARLGAAARVHALQRFSIDTMVAQYLALYDEVLGR